MNAFAEGCAWIEGEYVPVREARIPILDTGFVRSDLTYDVVGVWGGSFFRLDDHLDRLGRGRERPRVRPPERRARAGGNPPRGGAPNRAPRAGGRTNRPPRGAPP